MLGFHSSQKNPANCMRNLIHNLMQNSTLFYFDM